MEEEKNQSFLRMMTLKNNLLNTKKEEFPELYGKEPNLGLFFITLDEIVSKEQAFFLLDSSILEKVNYMIVYYRSQEEHSQYNEIVNRIIIQLNRLKTTTPSQKKSYIKRYQEYQEQSRHIIFPNLSTMIDVLASDAYIYIQIKNKNNLSELDDSYFLGAVNYFLKNIPQLFQDSEIYDATLAKLQAFSERTKSPQMIHNLVIRKSIQNLSKQRKKKEK